VKKKPFPIMPLFLLAVFVFGGCDLFDDYENNDGGQNKYPFIWYPYIPQPRIVQMYNRDGTKYTGNGMIKYCYTGEYGEVKLDYAKVTNGTFQASYSADEPMMLHSRWIEPDVIVSLIESCHEIGLNCGASVIDAPPNYTGADKTVTITGVYNGVSVELEGAGFSLSEYRFYEEDSNDYKIVELMREYKDTNGNVTKKIAFHPELILYGEPDYPPRYLPYDGHGAVSLSLKGALWYTQITAKNNRTETALVNVEYIVDVDSARWKTESTVGTLGMPDGNGGWTDYWITFYFNNLYTETTYTIFEESPDNVSYRADTIVRRHSGSKYYVGPKPSEVGARYTLVDRYISIK